MRKKTLLDVNDRTQTSQRILGKKRKLQGREREKREKTSQVDVKMEKLVVNKEKHRRGMCEIN
jgi:hypothetical protein